MALRANITIGGKLYQKLPDFFTDDYGFKLNFAVKNDDGTAHDLTSATVNFKMKAINATSVKVDSSCTISSATDGECNYTIQTGDLDTRDVYDAELQITKTGTSVQTVYLGRFKVVSDL